VWKEGTEGLLILSALTIFFATTFNLENISVAGSFGFLSIFAAVNLANFKLAEYTNSNRLLSLLGFFLCLTSGAVLIGYNLKTNPSSLKSVAVVLVGTLLFEAAYRAITRREIAEYIDWRLKHRERLKEETFERLREIVRAIKEKLKGAEVYLTGSAVKGAHATSTLRLLVVHENPKEAEEALKEVREKFKELPLEIVVKRKRERGAERLEE